MNLEGAVVIVDEAHNLVDAVNAVHSASITRKQLATAKSALDTYYVRFSGRLAPGAVHLCGSLRVRATQLLSGHRSPHLTQPNKEAQKQGSSGVCVKSERESA